MSIDVQYAIALLGRDAFYGSDGGACFLQPDGAVYDRHGRLVRSATSEGAALYLGFMAGLKASGTRYGGVRAAEKGDGDTVVCKIGTDGKLYVPTYPKAEMVSEAAGSAPTAAEFKALLDALKSAGMMAAE